MKKISSGGGGYGRNCFMY